MTGDAQLKPYTSWIDFAQHLKHPESLINFIAAYGTHSALTAADVDTMAEMRAAATALVLGGSATINAGGVGGLSGSSRPIPTTASTSSTAPASMPICANGVTTTGLDTIDFWIGGLAEEKMPFGGMLGSTFNFVFETQLENLQNGDRFYYLSRTAGLNFGTELENNSFAQLVMLNTDATHLPADIFPTPGLHPRGRPDEAAHRPGRRRPTPTRPAASRSTAVEVTRWSSATIPTTVGPDTNYLHYTGDQTSCSAAPPATTS